MVNLELSFLHPSAATSNNLMHPELTWQIDMGVFAKECRASPARQFPYQHSHYVSGTRADECVNRKLATAGPALCLILSGCASGNIYTDAPPRPSAIDDMAAEPVDLTGLGKQSNSRGDDFYQEAVTEDCVITINWVTNNGDTKSVYRVGRFQAPKDAAQPSIR